MFRKMNWRMATFAVIGVLVIGVAVQAGTPNIQVIDQYGNHVDVQLEAIDMNSPIVHAYAGPGVATGVSAEAIVWNAGINPAGETAHFFNMNMTTGAIFPGYMYADEMELQGGFTVGDVISSYQARLFRSSLDPNPALADVRLELWDGDPFGWVDTVGGGFTNLPIAGTGVDFLDIPGATRFQAHAILGKGIAPPNAKVWMVLSNTGGTTANAGPCRMGWILSRLAPSPGGQSGDHFEWQIDDDGSTGGAGTCCIGGEACVFGVTDCPETTPGTDRGWCADNGAELAQLLSFTGGCAEGACGTLVATISSPATATISLIPVAGDPVASIVGNEITLTNNGGWVKMEIKVSDWDVNDTGVQLKAFGANLDSAGYYSGDSGQLGPRMIACAVDSECVAAFGGTCTGLTTNLGGFCTSTADCPGFPTFPNQPCVGMKCTYPTGVGGFCEPGYILANKADYIFISQPDLPAVDLSTLDFRYASAVTAAPFIDDEVPWTGDKYAGTLQLDVSADAKGTFTVGILNNSVLVDQNSIFLPLVGFVPGIVTIQTGQCCIDLAGDGGCIDGMTEPQCQLMAGPAYNLGPVNYDTGKTCADPCIECLEDSNCNELPEDDLCTVDTCCLDPAGCATAAYLFCNDSTPFDCSDGLVCTTDLCDATTGCYYEAVPFDDGLDCTTDSCVEPTGVQNIATDPDDGDPCTVDVCCEAEEPAFLCTGEAGGTVVNADVTIYPCTVIEDCPAEAQGCALGYCFCDPCPRDEVYFDVSEVCADDGDKVDVLVMKPQSGSSVTGAQGTVYWDPTCVTFNSMTAIAPYDYTLPFHGTMGDGSIFFAVGVNPFGGVGEGNPSPFVALSFTKIGECNTCNFTLGGVNPYDFILEAEGYNCNTPTLPSDYVTDTGTMMMTIPAGAELNVDCDYPTVIYTWDDAASCDSDCGDCEMLCTANHDDGVDIDHLIIGGGEFPQGVSTFTCTATTTGDCPADPISDSWTVVVSDQQALDVVIQLSPIMVGNVTRCIEFELYENCVAPPVLENENLFFGGAYDHLGHYTSQIKVAKGQFVCITARDQHHSLRSVAYPDCDGSVYSAVFKGDPYFAGGNWLVQGNLDGEKKDDPFASHDVIDILDFGKFVQHFGEVVSLTSGCDLDGTHADINGDGVVDHMDFTFITTNFLMSSKNSCCGDVAGEPIPITSISVRELRANGMESLISADLNRDGMLDMKDMSAFLAGEVPEKTKRSVRPGSGLRR